MATYLHKGFAIARLGWIVLLGLVSVGLSAPAHASHWQTGMPDGSTMICASGIACARAQQKAYYGGWPNIKEKDCYLTSSYYGFMDGATCEGETWYAGCVRNGYAGLVCDSGEVRIGTGCVTKPPFVKCPTCKPQNPGPQANTNVGNPIDTRSGLKTEYALDFSTEGADPL